MLVAQIQRALGSQRGQLAGDQTNRQVGSEPLCKRSQPETGTGRHDPSVPTTRLMSGSNSTGPSHATSLSTRTLNRRQLWIGASFSLSVGRLVNHTDRIEIGVVFVVLTHHMHQVCVNAAVGINIAISSMDQSTMKEQDLSRTEGNLHTSSPDYL